MGYYIDLEKIAICDYRIKLETAYLPPSRMILKGRLEERFGYFENIGIKNVKELIQVLKKKDKFSELQKVECLSGDYLVLLLRELNSTLPKPVRIKDFSGISNETVSKLENAGIKNTVKLFDRVINSKSRRPLAAEIQITEKEALKLTKLTDLSRIRWVGATFAKILYDLGIDTVNKVTKADPTVLHAKVNQLNKEKGIYKGQIGLNDMKIVVNIAKDVPQDIEY